MFDKDHGRLRVIGHHLLLLLDIMIIEHDLIVETGGLVHIQITPNQKLVGGLILIIANGE
jgi:hypothetical protein